MSYEDELDFHPQCYLWMHVYAIAEERNSIVDLLNIILVVAYL